METSCVDYAVSQQQQQQQEFKRKSSTHVWARGVFLSSFYFPKQIVVTHDGVVLELSHVPLYQIGLLL